MLVAGIQPWIGHVHIRISGALVCFSSRWSTYLKGRESMSLWWRCHPQVYFPDAYSGYGWTRSWKLSPGLPEPSWWPGAALSGSWSLEQKLDIELGTPIWYPGILITRPNASLGWLFLTYFFETYISLCLQILVLWIECDLTKFTCSSPNPTVALPIDNMRPWCNKISVIVRRDLSGAGAVV